MRALPGTVFLELRLCGVSMEGSLYVSKDSVSVPLLGDDSVLSLTTVSVGLFLMTAVGGTCVFVQMEY